MPSKDSNINNYKNLIQQNKNGAGDFVVVEGLHTVKHALRFNAQPVLVLIKDSFKLNKLINQLCPDLKLKLKQLGSITSELGYSFDSLTDSKIQTGILGIFKKPKVLLSEKKVESGIQVLIDNPKDLNNLGAIVRTSAAAGINSIIIIGELNIWNHRAIRAGAGLQFAMSCLNLSLSQALKINLPFISFDERGQELNSNTKLKIKDLKKQSGGVVYIFGSERSGISDQLKLKSDLILRIPMQEKVSSLNLATSVAIALYT